MEKAKIVLIRRTQLHVRIFKRVVDTITTFIMKDAAMTIKNMCIMLDVGMTTITMTTNIMSALGMIIMIIQIVVVTITKMKN